jgi:hypothetical protein
VPGGVFSGTDAERVGCAGVTGALERTRRSVRGSEGAVAGQEVRPPVLDPFPVAPPTGSWTAHARTVSCLTRSEEAREDATPADAGTTEKASVHVPSCAFHTALGLVRRATKSCASGARTNGSEPSSGDRASRRTACVRPPSASFTSSGASNPKTGCPVASSRSTSFACADKGEEKAAPQAASSRSFAVAFDRGGTKASVPGSSTSATETLTDPVRVKVGLAGSRVKVSVRVRE